MKNFGPYIGIGILIYIFMGGKFGLFLPLLILFIAFNAMQKNKDKVPPGERPGPRNRRRSRNYDSRRQTETSSRPTYEERRRPSRPERPRPKPRPRSIKNPYKSSGVQKYKDFDYDGAIEDFKKALEINPKDIPTHFNIACAYSLTEQKDLAYQHIDAAVRLGFKDFEKIRNHDAFAYIRIQDDFEAFEQNGFRISAQMDTPAANSDAVDPLLLERLKKLSELRDRGILTEAEFLVQKEKLLQR